MKRAKLVRTEDRLKEVRSSFKVPEALSRTAPFSATSWWEEQVLTDALSNWPVAEAMDKAELSW